MNDTAGPASAFGTVSTVAMMNILSKHGLSEESEPTHMNVFSISGNQYNVEWHFIHNIRPFRVLTKI
jgi:hypothetical protein